MASRLGVSHAALYTYVRDRDDLVIAAIDRLSERVDLPDQVGAWRDYLRAEAMFIWEVFRAYPGVAEALGETGQAPGNFQAHLVRAHDYLVSLGFEPQPAFLALDMVWDLAGDAAKRGTDLERRIDREQLASLWSEPLGDGLADLMMQAMLTEPVVWFEAKLDIVLAGIGATLAPSSASSG